MTIQIHDPAMPHLTDEKAFSIRDKEGDGVLIHPWIRDEDGGQPEVSIVAGSITGYEDDTEDHSDEFGITIVNRADFVEGLLVVFPELSLTKGFSLEG